MTRLAQPGSKVVRLASAEPKGGSAGFSRTLKFLHLQARLVSGADVAEWRG